MMRGQMAGKEEKVDEEVREGDMRVLKVDLKMGHAKKEGGLVMVSPHAFRIMRRTRSHQFFKYLVTSVA